MHPINARSIHGDGCSGRTIVCAGVALTDIGCGEMTGGGGTGAEVAS